MKDMNSLVTGLTYMNSPLVSLLFDHRGPIICRIRQMDGYDSLDTEIRIKKKKKEGRKESPTKDGERMREG